MTSKELDLILQGGEDYRNEFKRSVDSSLSKELVAFSNGNGGRVFLGVEDDATITGIKFTNTLKFENRVEISNPGGLPKGLTKDEFGKRSIARNPTIAAMLHRVHYIERMGTGISRIKNAMRDAKLSIPEFRYDGFFTVILKRKFKITPLKNTPENKKTEEEISGGLSGGLNGGISGGINGGVNGGVNPEIPYYTIKEALLEFLKTKGKMQEISLSESVFLRIFSIVTEIKSNKGQRITELISKLNLTEKIVERDLTILKKYEIIKFSGSKKTGKYILTPSFEKFLKSRSKK